MLDGDLDFDLWEPSRFLDFDYRVGVAEALDLPDLAPFLLALSLLPLLPGFSSLAPFFGLLLLALVPALGSFLPDLALLADLLDFPSLAIYTII